MDLDGWAPSSVDSVSLRAKIAASGCNRSQSFYTSRTMDGWRFAKLQYSTSLGKFSAID